VLRAVREAFPAQAALTAVLLAREGVAGFEAPLEGRAGFYALYAGGAFSADDLADRLGTHFWGTELTFKPWPSCRGTHPFIEMALDLRGRHGFAPAAVAGIDVEVDEVQHMLVDPLERKQAPAVAIDAKFSIPFTTALALTRGGVGLDDFDADTLADPQVLALSALVRPRIAKAPAWQRGTGGAMGIRLHDGTFLEAMVPDALGCPARPLPPAAQHAKFVDCLAHAALPRGRIRRNLWRPRSSRWIVAKTWAACSCNRAQTACRRRSCGAAALSAVFRTAHGSPRGVAIVRVARPLPARPWAGRPFARGSPRSCPAEAAAAFRRCWRHARRQGRPAPR
jgi:2-methylcitrate dehydratase PrpD